MTSQLTLAEVLVKPLADENEQAIAQYRALLRGREQFEVIPIAEAVLIGAARLRSKGRLRLPDAFHVASALVARRDIFMTNDARIKTPAGLDCLRLSDLAGAG